MMDANADGRRQSPRLSDTDWLVSGNLGAAIASQAPRETARVARGRGRLETDRAGDCLHASGVCPPVRETQPMTRAAPRYLLISISCAVMYNVTVIAGDFLGLHYLTSTLIAFAIVVPWGYGLHSFFTFDREMSARSLFLYALGMAVNLPLSIILMFVFCSVAGIPVAFAVPATTLMLFVWNFVSSRWAILGSPAREGSA
jgi:putative flippase GtrA